MEERILNLESRWVIWHAFLLVCDVNFILEVCSKLLKPIKCGLFIPVIPVEILKQRHQEFLGVDDLGFPSLKTDSCILCFSDLLWMLSRELGTFIFLISSENQVVS